MYLVSMIQLYYTYNIGYNCNGGCLMVLLFDKVNRYHRGLHTVSSELSSNSYASNKRVNIDHRGLRSL